MNLGQPERVYMFGLGVPILAIIVALTTYVQSKVTMPASTNPGDQGAMMNKMMALYMPLLLGYFALTFASGLSIYFITGNLIGIAQYALLGKVNWRAVIPGYKPETTALGEEQMNERTTLEKIAPTVDEAVAEGLSELGLGAEAVDVEVLDNGSRGLFGVGSRQARVRLTVKSTGFRTWGWRGKNLGGARKCRSPDLSKSGSEEISEAAFNVLDDNLLFVSRQTVAELLEKMKIPAHVEVRYGDLDEEGQRPVLVDVEGDDLGVLIGRRAEILNALQYITNLIVSKQVERWVQVVIDVQGYRARHERQLRQMAQRMADQAMKAGRRQVLEPMSASDRRIIHLEFRDHPSVTTQSVGEEPTRKVTIVPKE